MGIGGLQDVDPKLIRHVINTVVPFKTILGSIGIFISGAEESIYCPFHDNTETRAAKLFKDKEGDKIWCFAERRMYRPYDVFKEGLTDKDPEVVYRRIWSKLDNQTKERIISEMGKGFNIKPKNWDLLEGILTKYKRGEASYSDVLKGILRLEVSIDV